MKRHLLPDLAVFPLTIFFLFYYFVFQQVWLVPSWPLFFGVLFILILLSFLITLTETAYASLASPEISTKARILFEKRLAELGNEISRTKVERDNAKHASNSSGRVSGGYGDPRTARRTQIAAEERLRELSRTRDRVRNRKRVMAAMHLPALLGSLTTLSVIVNAALLAFLPVALLNIDGSTVLTAAGLSESTAVAFDHPHRAAFIFLIATLPTLVFGTLVPQRIGRAPAISFAYRLYWVGIFAWAACGPIVRWTHKSTDALRPAPIMDDALPE